MVSTCYHDRLHPLTATRAWSPTGSGVVGLSHLPRYDKVAKLILGNSCDVGRHTARRFTPKERVDVYGGHGAASVNKASATDMVVRLAAGWLDGKN